MSKKEDRRRLVYDGESPYPSPELVALLAAGVLPGKRALEAGCGIASDALLLASEGWRVDAIDLDRRALAQARRRATQLGLDVSFQEGDAAALPFDDGTFDLVLDRLLWNNVLADGNGARYVAELARVTRPGARVLVRAKSAEWHTVADSFREGSARDLGGRAVWRAIDRHFRARAPARRVMLVAPAGPLVPANVLLLERRASRRGD